MKEFVEYKTIIENYIDSNIPKISPAELFEPYKYILQLPSKRIRPIMLLAIHDCFKPMNDDALNCAMTIELFHNFTLMHDDIMDKSDTRRGMATVHKKYNENIAILSGDVLLILTYQLLEKQLQAPNFSEIFKLYNKTAIEICSGQQLDMNFESQFQISEMEYLLMIEYKTAVLLATSMKIGAILGNANAEDCDNIFKFGLNIGMAFQIQDDLLDSFGNTAETGKIVGGDICNNKKTLLMIKAMQSPNRYHKELINNWLQTQEFNEQKVSDFKTIFEESGAYKYVVAKRDVYYDKALAFLEKTSISESNKVQLTKFAQKATVRIQ